MTKWLMARRWRVVMTGIMIAVLPLLGLALFVHFEVTRALKEEAVESNRLLTGVAARQIENRLRQSISLGRAYATRPSLHHALERADGKALQAHLENLVANSESVQRAVICSREGIELAAHPYDPRVIGQDFSHRDWYRGVTRNWSPYVSEFYLRAGRPQRFLFAIALPIAREEGEVLGILVLQPTEDYIQKTLADVSLANGLDRLAYVVDRNGHLIFHPSHLMDRVIDLSDIPAVAKLRKGLAGVEVVTNGDGEEVLAGYQPIAPWGWGVVIERPLRDVLASAQRGTLGLFLSTGVLALMAGIFAFKGADLLVRTERLAREREEGERNERLSSEFLALLNRQWPALETLGQAYLDTLSALVSVEAGVVWLADGETLTPCAALAVQPPDGGSALAQRCFRQGKTHWMRDLPPENHLRVETSAGVLLPRDVVAIPLSCKDQVLGVLELACVHGFNERERSLFDRIVPRLSIAIDTLKSHLALERLTEQVADANEELQAMNEELRVTNEQLMIQGEELDAANASLVEVSRAKLDFLANMSHELRTPLNAVIGFSELLEDRMAGPINEKQQEYIHDILESGRHLLALINDILDLAKVESGRMELEPSRFSLRECLAASLLLFREKALKHDIDLKLVPAPGADIEIEADQRKFKQIFYNLLSNAVKFTPDGGAVTLEARRTDAGIEITVADTGIGIASEDIPRLFTEFCQLESPDTKRFEGTGLGLALTRKLVELHGGTIGVESEPGKGSRFAVSLPLPLPGGAGEGSQEARAGHGRS